MAAKWPGDRSCQMDLDAYMVSPPVILTNVWIKGARQKPCHKNLKPWLMKKTGCLEHNTYHVYIYTHRYVLCFPSAHCEWFIQRNPLLPMAGMALEVPFAARSNQRDGVVHLLSRHTTTALSINEDETRLRQESDQSENMIFVFSLCGSKRIQKEGPPSKRASRSISWVVHPPV